MELITRVLLLEWHPNPQRRASERVVVQRYSQAQPGRELTQPSPRLLAEPCTHEAHEAFGLKSITGKCSRVASGRGRMAARAVHTTLPIEGFPS